MARKKNAEVVKSKRKRTAAKKAAPKKSSAKKSSAKKSSAKKTPPTKKSSTMRSSAKKKAKVNETELFPPEMNLGELLWEYRARTAEWEKAFAEANLANHKVVQEKTDPKYKKLFDLMADNDRKRAEIQLAATRLKQVQSKAAEKLGLTLDDFVKNCTVDHDTGLVRFLD